MSSTCVRPKERGKKKNQKEGRGGGPLECACASLPRAKMNEAFFLIFFPLINFRKRTFSYPYPPVPCCPHPLSKVPMFPVPTQFLPRVGCFVSNEICNRQPATLGLLRWSPSEFFFPTIFCPCLLFPQKKIGKIWKNVCVCDFFCCKLD